jgi:hypothetical protein
MRINVEAPLGRPISNSKILYDMVHKTKVVPLRWIGSEIKKKQMFTLER